MVPVARRDRAEPAPVRSGAAPASAKAGPRRAASSALRVRGQLARQRQRVAERGRRLGARREAGERRAGARCVAEVELRERDALGLGEALGVRREVRSSSASLGSRSRAGSASSSRIFCASRRRTTRSLSCMPSASASSTSSVVAARVVGPREAQVLDQAPAHHVVAQLEAAREGLADEQRILVERGAGGGGAACGGVARSSANSSPPTAAKRSQGRLKPASRRVPDRRRPGALLHGALVQRVAAALEPLADRLGPSRSPPSPRAQMRWLQRQVGFSSTRA